MNGHVYAALMLVGAGNRFLGGGDVSGFWPRSVAYRFTRLCEFRLPPEVRGSEEYPLLADDPLEWFATLKPWCRGLRLHHDEPTRAPNQQLDVSNRMLAGMVGGGQRWLIEPAGDEQSEIWEPFNRLGDRKDPERKIWLCTHIRQGVTARAQIDEEMAGETLEGAARRLREALGPIEAYARREQYTNFADIFEEAMDWLDGAAKPPEDTDAARFTTLDERARAVLSATSLVDVFGGMGSWNDLGGGDEYERVSQALYEAMNDCTMAVANATFHAPVS